MEKKTSGTRYSPNGHYLLFVVNDMEYLYHLSTPWQMASATTLLDDGLPFLNAKDDMCINKVIKQILRRTLT